MDMGFSHVVEVLAVSSRTVEEFTCDQARQSCRELMTAGELRGHKWWIAGSASPERWFVPFTVHICFGIG